MANFVYTQRLNIPPSENNTINFINFFVIKMYQLRLQTKTLIALSLISTYFIVIARLKQ